MGDCYLSPPSNRWGLDLASTSLNVFVGAPFPEHDRDIKSCKTVGGEV